MINKLSDIQVGKEYDLYVVKAKRLARKAVVHGLINESVEFPPTGKTEIYLSIYRRGKLNSCNLFYASEIGLGETKDEAFRNYGRFRYEENDAFDKSYDEVEARRRKRMGW